MVNVYNLSQDGLHQNWKQIDFNITDCKTKLIARHSWIVPALNAGKHYNQIYIYVSYVVIIMYE